MNMQLQLFTEHNSFPDQTDAGFMKRQPDAILPHLSNAQNVQHKIVRVTLTCLNNNIYYIQL